jgi:hypothetical protein
MGTCVRDNLDDRIHNFACGDAGAKAATRSTGFQPLDLFVGCSIDLVELRPKVINQLSDLVDYAEHCVVELRLVHHSDRSPEIHPMHAVDHRARIVGVQPVSRSPDRASLTIQLIGLFAQALSGIRPGPRIGKRP